MTSREYQLTNLPLGHIIKWTYLQNYLIFTILRVIFNISNMKKSDFRSDQKNQKPVPSPIENSMKIHHVMIIHRFVWTVVQFFGSKLFWYCVLKYMSLSCATKVTSLRGSYHDFYFKIGWKLDELSNILFNICDLVIPTHRPVATTSSISTKT